MNKKIYADAYKCLKCERLYESANQTCECGETVFVVVDIQSSADNFKIKKEPMTDAQYLRDCANFSETHWPDDWQEGKAHIDRLRSIAARLEVDDKIREAAKNLLSNEEHAVSGGMRSYTKGSPTWRIWENLRNATHWRPLPKGPL